MTFLSDPGRSKCHSPLSRPYEMARTLYLVYAYARARKSACPTGSTPDEVFRMGFCNKKGGLGLKPKKRGWGLMLGGSRGNREGGWFDAAVGVGFGIVGV